MSNKKTKQVGKIVVVILSVAIFFFLLLPFLEPDSETAKEGSAKKATPQIFTSNPLSELARKIYAMFSGKSRSKAPRIPSQQQANTLEGENVLALAPTETERYSAAHESDPHVSTVGVTYDEYGEAGFINEEGEWVLIRQTAPETAQRGMHEVSATDKAYDKYVQLERSAKYIGKPEESANIPESKWARLWKPIKKLFSKDEETPSVNEEDTEKSWALASASSGLGKDREKYISSRASKALKPDLSGNMQFSLNDNGRDAFFNLIHSDIVFDETAQRLKEQAREMLGSDSPRLKDIDKQIEHDKREAYRQAQRDMQAAFTKRLEQAAEEQSSLRAPTVDDMCESGGSSLYGCTTSSPFPEEKTEQETTASDNTPAPSFADIYQQITNKELPNGFKNNPINVVVVLSKTNGESAEDLFSSSRTEEDPKTTRTEEQLTQEALDFLYKDLGWNDNVSPAVQKEAKELINKEIIKAMYRNKGCEHQPCYAFILSHIPSSTKAADILNGAGVEHNGGNTASLDPLEEYTQGDIGPLLQKIPIPAPAGTKPDNNSQGFTLDDLKPELIAGSYPSIGFYNQEDKDKLVKLNSHPIIKEDGTYGRNPKATILMPVSAETGKALAADGVPANQIIVEENTDILPQNENSGHSMTNPTTFTQGDVALAGKAFNDQDKSSPEQKSMGVAKTIANHLVIGQEIIENNLKNMVQSASSNILKAGAEQTQEDIANGKISTDPTQLK